MELRELTERTKEIFKITSMEQLKHRMYETVTGYNIEIYRAFKDTVQDLTVDWIQKIYEYYLSDRKEKKQDYTPKSLGQLLSQLLPKQSVVLDMCAGCGALTIQYWANYPDTTFICKEIDENVIPFLLFNLALRNINAVVIQEDILTGEKKRIYTVEKTEEFGKVKICDDISIHVDACIANPPFNLAWEPELFIQVDKRFSHYGIPPKNNANYAFILTGLQEAEESAWILPSSVLDPKAEQQEIMKNLVEANVLKAVISCPRKMFENTDISVVVMVLSKKKSYATVEMVDCRNFYEEQMRIQNGQYGGNPHTKRTYQKKHICMERRTDKYYCASRGAARK